jgi:hypothetical protein
VQSAVLLLGMTGLVMALQRVLAEVRVHLAPNRVDSGEVRNPELSTSRCSALPLTLAYGGYRVEGHHLSQNYTVVNGDVVDVPSFFGANPAQIQEGPRKGLSTVTASRFDRR